jgi:ATP-binding cassette subfamily B (MDR/TAP) protein 1
VPVISAASFVYMYMLQNSKKRTQRIYEVAGGIAEQAITAVKTVKCLRGEDFEAKKYSTHIYDAMIQSFKFTTGVGFAQGMVYFAMFCNYALGFWYGAKLIEDQTNNTVFDRPYNIGDVMIIFFAIQTGSFSLGQAMPCLENFAHGRTSGYKLF